MFTRKHFQRVADEIRASQLPWPAKVEWAGVMAAMFADDNPRFDQDRFLDAAGVRVPPCEVCGELDDEHLPGCALQESFLSHPAQGVTT